MIFHMIDHMIDHMAVHMKLKNTSEKSQFLVLEFTTDF